MKSRRGPIQLPPLAHSFLDSHLPSHVVRNLTQPSDVDTVLTLEKSIEKYFKKIGKKAKIIKLYGAIELGPLTGLSDFICDLTATGATLKEHDLKIIDTVLESTAYLIANPVGMRIHYDHITGIMRQLTDVI